MKFFSIFLAFYLFFPHDKLFLGFILNLENAEMWSPPVIGPVARRRMLIGQAGRHSPVAARVDIIRPCRKRKPPPRCLNARVSRVRRSLRCRPPSHTALLHRAGPATPLAVLGRCLSSCQSSVVHRARTPSESLLPTALSARSWSECRSQHHTELPSTGRCLA
jgi:hypothetical protein